MWYHTSITYSNQNILSVEIDEIKCIVIESIFFDSKTEISYFLAR